MEKTYTTDDIGFALNNASDDIERSVKLTRRELDLLHLLITAGTAYLKGEADSLGQVLERFLDGELQIIDRDLIRADNLPGVVYERQRAAALAEFLRRLNEINPNPGTRWRGEPVQVSADAQRRGQYERLEFWRLSDELAAELDR